ncbi:transporter [Pseudomonas syringae]|uniref:transporter n=1 Tax=Pseudomonas syringae TaxID=317 RepID=UPI00215ABA63|nr:transporter [Pseudomonas syringae]MCR8717712.1 transporter [Pseudomonas syringae]
MNKKIVSLAVVLPLYAAVMQQAQAAGDAMARDYIPAPGGVDLAVMYLAHKQANTYVSDGKDKGADFSTDMVVARYVHFMEVGGMIIDPQIILPMGNLNVDIPGAVDRRKTGVGDMVLLSSFWFVNDPSSKTYVAFTPYITVPTGTYNDNSPGSSLGSHRWSYTAEVGMTKGFGEKTTLDLIGAVDFFGSNDDYQGQKQKKDKVLSVQAIYAYNLTPTVWASAKYTYATGGETRLSNTWQNDETKVQTVALGVAKQMTKKDNLQVEYVQDVKVNNAFETRGVRMRYVHAF